MTSAHIPDMNDSTLRSRAPKGSPVGGQFTTESKAESSVSLDPQPLPPIAYATTQAVAGLTNFMSLHRDEEFDPQVVAGPDTDDIPGTHCTTWSTSGHLPTTGRVHVAPDGTVARLHLHATLPSGAHVDMSADDLENEDDLVPVVAEFYLRARWQDSLDQTFGPRDHGVTVQDASDESYVILSVRDPHSGTHAQVTYSTVVGEVVEVKAGEEFGEEGHETPSVNALMTGVRLMRDGGSQVYLDRVLSEVQDAPVRYGIAEDIGY